MRLHKMFLLLAGPLTSPVILYAQSQDATFKTSSIKERSCLIRHSRDNGNPDPTSTWIPFINGMRDTAHRFFRFWTLKRGEIR